MSTVWCRSQDVALAFTKLILKGSHMFSFINFYIYCCLYCSFPSRQCGSINEIWEEKMKKIEGYDCVVCWINAFCVTNTARAGRPGLSIFTFLHCLMLIVPRWHCVQYPCNYVGCQHEITPLLFTDVKTGQFRWLAASPKHQKTHLFITCLTH